MKNIFFFFILVSTTLTYGQKFKQDLKLKKLTGKVKSVKETYFKVKDSFGIAVKSKKTYSNYNILSFNKNGYLTEERSYNNFDKLKTKVTVSFDKRGNKREINQYSGTKGELAFRQSRVYNSRGKLMTLKEFTAYHNGDVKLNATSEFKYDKKRKLIEVNVFLPGGDLETKTLHKYNLHENLIKQENKYDSNGQLKTRISEYRNPKKVVNEYFNEGVISSKTTYLLDNKKRIIGEESSTDDGAAGSSSKVVYDKYDNIIEQVNVKLKFGFNASEDFYKFSYKFDDNNNWTERVSSKNEDFTLIVEREIEYY